MEPQCRVSWRAMRPGNAQNGVSAHIAPVPGNLPQEWKGSLDGDSANRVAADPSRGMPPVLYLRHGLHLHVKVTDQSAACSSPSHRPPQVHSMVIYNIRRLGRTADGKSSLGWEPTSAPLSRFLCFSGIGGTTGPTGDPTSFFGSSQR